MITPRKELTQERDRIRSETVWLARQKAAAIGELRRLQDLIEDAVDAVEGAAAITAPALENGTVHAEDEPVELPAPPPGEPTG